MPADGEEEALCKEKVNNKEYSLKANKAGFFPQVGKNDAFDPQECFGIPTFSCSNSIYYKPKEELAQVVNAIGISS